MTEDELKGIVLSAAQDAEDYAESVIGPERAELTRYYKGEPFGDEKEGQSAFVSRDVADTVAKVMPSVMRTFFGSERVVSFSARSMEDIAKAEQATDYINHIVTEDNDGFRIFFCAVKDALTRKGGFIKWWWDDSEEVRGTTYSGLDPMTFAALAAEPGVEVSEQTTAPDGTISCELRRKVKVNRARIAAIPPEEFIIARDATCIDDASIVGHVCERTVSDLVAMGYDQKEMLDLADAGSSDSDEKTARNEFGEDGDARTDPAMRRLKYRELYVRVDFDGDGVAELRKICMVGEAGRVVHNKIANMAQICDLAADPEPHTFYGGCPGESVKDIQRVKSQIIRLALDSMVQEVHPREWAVEGQVNMSDLMAAEVGGVVRVRAPGMVGHIQTGNAAPMALQFSAFFDDVKESRTGQSKASAGLAADSLQSTTRAGVEMTREASNDRKDLIVRLFAHGFKRLGKGLLRLVAERQDKPRVVRLRNEYVSVDPRSWDVTMDMSTNMGLGLGNVEETTAFLQGTLAAQQAAMEKLGPGNPLVSFAQIYNTLDDLARLHGKQVSRYFLKPDPNWKPPAPPPQPDPNAALLQAEQYKADKKAQTDLARIKADADAERDKLLVQALTKVIELGATPESLPTWGQFINQTITAPRVDAGTQIQGVQ